jgi:hypothetical protein
MPRPALWRTAATTCGSERGARRRARQLRVDGGGERYEAMARILGAESRWPFFRSENDLSDKCRMGRRSSS